MHNWSDYIDLVCYGTYSCPTTWSKNDIHCMGKAHLAKEVLDILGRLSAFKVEIKTLACHFSNIYFDSILVKAWQKAFHHCFPEFNCWIFLDRHTNILYTLEKKISCILRGYSVASILWHLHCLWIKFSSWFLQKASCIHIEKAYGTEWEKVTNKQFSLVSPGKSNTRNHSQFAMAQ